MHIKYFIDTHTHIYYNQGQALDGHIERCFQNNIKKLLLPNVDYKSISMVTKAVERYPEVCIPMIGLHPCSVQSDYRDQLQQIEPYLSKLDICAIGEIGIDLHWDKTTFKWQQDAFEKQIYWALERNLPIDIHCREAFEETFDILESIKPQKPQLYGVFHCFTGSYDQAVRALDLGFKLGVGGVVTFKNAGLDKVISKLSLEDILLETDSPYLAPVPFRGKQNESSYLVHVAQKIADIFHTDLDTVAQITSNNAKQIFKI